ncbi:MAG TPA: OmpA family protein [Stellaceae bacterium]|nr:OmpA family protein [Stellaceae bacterium]
MPILHRSAIALLALALATAAARAEEPAGAYFHLNLGANFLEGLSVTGPSGNQATLNQDPGYLINTGPGYAFGNGFRAEIDLGYRHNDAKNVTLPGGGTTPTSLNLKANAAARSYMVDGLYDFHIGSSAWTPYIGFGVGAANVRVNNIGSDTPFAWQALAGVEYPVTRRVYLGVGYKYLATEDLHLRTTSANLSSHAEYQSHAAMLTFRLKFGVPKPPPPAPAPEGASMPPPVLAAPAPLPRSFTVYFDFDSAALTPSGREIVRQAAATAAGGGMTLISVTGHTDTVGTARYNLKLSERRADAVRNEMVAVGIPSAEIITVGRGEADLAVPTPPNVNEPRNRRVVIQEGGPGS